MKNTPLRHLVLILGDQLDAASSAFEGFDPTQDAVVMIEAREESTHVWSHKVRTTLFLSAMRHFAEQLQERGWTVHYRRLEKENDASLASGLLAAVQLLRPKQVIGVEPGDLRVKASLDDAINSIAAAAGNHWAAGLFDPKLSPLEWREDKHFLCSPAEFKQWAAKSTSLRMEYFYRRMRKQHRVLVEGPEHDQPVGGQWNFDADNRKSFGKAGPQNLPTPPRFAADALTQEVIALVEREFPGHPGSDDCLARFNWPVTRVQALEALSSFITQRLAQFGPHEDAMWTGLEFGWHSLLSSSLNLKLISPLEVVQAAEKAYSERGLDLASVEGFVRQVLGWREFMRGVYFLDMPQLKTANHFNHQRALPAWYWTGNTRMNCMKQCLTQTLDNGYSHHIQRLMVTGMFGVTAQISPQAVCDWYLAVYVDAVEWAELPNTAGMALFAHGARFTTKPYVASGAYVKRMSNYCTGCTYESDARTGAKACPLTVLYWNFLDEHEDEFSANPRTALMVKNLQRMSPEQRQEVQQTAARMLADLDAL
jgi:deoxyribodipyrimidine photolyase-related protein